MDSYYNILQYGISQVENLKYEEIETKIDFYIVISKDGQIISSYSYIKYYNFNKDKVREEMIQNLLILFIKKSLATSILEVKDHPDFHTTVDKLKKYLNNKVENL